MLTHTVQTANIKVRYVLAHGILVLTTAGGQTRQHQLQQHNKITGAHPAMHTLLSGVTDHAKWLA